MYRETGLRFNTILKKLKLSHAENHLPGLQEEDGFHEIILSSMRFSPDATTNSTPSRVIGHTRANGRIHQNSSRRQRSLRRGSSSPGLIPNGIRQA
ncbi:hypothetical protein RY831_10090 [Noviherbaspirillum sp. CPCC 100848]|uniref:Uncharacterized protein n=1 Tax=Noviherbaspirillum album TaxID=3080276 RepID=A0ABU6J891_9BURK|nr:hypothetical protein [Noviherbaspirillum sp. CPCC 100848]MEC4719502.1 hypothetical protein [Noviherbaspirillum sp. CPCC 100848]